MRPQLRSFAALAALVAGSAPAGSSRVAVVTLDAPPQLRFTGKSVAEAFAQQAAGAGVEVVGPTAVEERLGRAGHAELVRCALDARCLAERGAKLGVDRIVAGRLTQHGGSYHVALVQADAATGERLGAIARDVPVAARTLQRDVAATAPTLLAGAKDASGVLQVITDVPGAQVAIDDVHAGTTPLTRTVRPGRHKVLVSREGFADVEPSWVDVPAGETVAHRPRLFRLPARDRPNASATSGQGTAVEIVK